MRKGPEEQNIGGSSAFRSVNFLQYWLSKRITRYLAVQ